MIDMTIRSSIRVKPSSACRAVCIRFSAVVFTINFVIDSSAKRNPVNATSNKTLSDLAGQIFPLDLHLAEIAEQR
jgi:hypothetical protein